MTGTSDACWNEKGVEDERCGDADDVEVGFWQSIVSLDIAVVTSAIVGAVLLLRKGLLLALLLVPLLVPMLVTLLALLLQTLLLLLLFRRA